MAVCMIFTPPKDIFTKATYDKVMDLLGDRFPPSAMSFHAMGHTAEGEVRIVDVFESAEEFEAFAQTHAPAYEELGVSVEQILEHATLFEIERKISR